jgi:hypothetical protein
VSPPPDPRVSSTGPLGYCTNVHPGHDLATTQAQLDVHAVDVRQRLGWERMGVGLWLSRNTATELQQRADGLSRFADWLHVRGLVPYTLNGFPYGDFHGDVVKHQVYQPTWAERDRYQYTLDLAHLLAGLLPACAAGTTGTISTLPLGWREQSSDDFWEQSARWLRQLACDFERLEEVTGCRVDVCLEPEPGCAIGDMASLIDYFRRYLWVGDASTRARNARYLSVCYDTCHAAVMHESAARNVQALQADGIRIGKAQISSAVEVDFDVLTPPQKQAAWSALHGFSEPRYLHQTVVYRPGVAPAFFVDLPDALADPTLAMTGCWTVHFHVPIFAAAAGPLGTTQAAIFDFIEATRDRHWLPTHWEVETYAWNVLPSHLQAATLGQGIAREVAALCQWLGPDPPVSR